MALYAPTYLFSATVYKWEDRDAKRVFSEVDGTTYILNTNGITNLIAKPNLTYGKSSMYYFDNPFDSRDQSHYMVTDHTAAEIIAHMDHAADSLDITLAVLPTGDPTESTENHTFGIWQVAYARAVTDSYYATQSYVWVRENLGFKVKRLRVSMTLTAILALTNAH
jgi:hypothetical protein